jgi:2-amino-4-hydroxy-6-hydroxymethyldihydropteridine diphosphokinase
VFHPWPRKLSTVNRAYVSLGSNIEPESNLPAAVRLLTGLGRVAAVSRVWQSAPVGDVNQPDFCNAAVLLETDLDAEALCVELRRIESRLGRIRDPHNKNAPRTIDLDLSLFNDDVREVGGRNIPDPDILTRSFVAGPLAEIAPEAVHPVMQTSLAEIAAAILPRTVLRLRTEIVLQKP